MIHLEVLKQNWKVIEIIAYQNNALCLFLLWAAFSKSQITIVVSSVMQHKAVTALIHDAEWPPLTGETPELVLEVKSLQGGITQCLTAVFPSGMSPSPACTLVLLGPASCQHSRRGEASSFGQVTFLSQLTATGTPWYVTGRGWDGFFEWQC